MPIRPCCCPPNRITVDPKKVESGFRMIFAGFPSFLGFGVRGQSASNFLASTVPSPKFNMEAHKGPYIEDSSLTGGPPGPIHFHVNLEEDMDAIGKTVVSPITYLSRILCPTLRWHWHYLVVPMPS